MFVTNLVRWKHNLQLCWWRNQFLQGVVLWHCFLYKFGDIPSTLTHAQSEPMNPSWSMQQHLESFSFAACFFLDLLSSLEADHNRQTAKNKYPSASNKLWMLPSAMTACILNSDKGQQDSSPLTVVLGSVLYILSCFDVTSLLMQTVSRKSVYCFFSETNGWETCWSGSLNYCLLEEGMTDRSVDSLVELV